MTNEVTQPNMHDIEQILINGDLARLSPEQRVQYYGKVCETASLNPLTKPFDFITLNGKLVLYANKGCAEQLRKVHKISIRITSRETIEGVYVITVEASGPDGRVDSATGAVPIMGLKGDHLANAFLKCETKAKRRVTLSICGLNMLDELEVGSIPLLPPSVRPEQPPLDGSDGNTEPLEYRVGFGQWKGRSLEQVYGDVGPEKMIAYIDYLERVSGQKQKPLGNEAVDFMRRVEEFLGSMENQPLDPIIQPRELPRSLDRAEKGEKEPGWDG